MEGRCPENTREFLDAARLNAGIVAPHIGLTKHALNDRLRGSVSWKSYESLLFIRYLDSRDFDVDPYLVLQWALADWRKGQSVG